MRPVERVAAAVVAAAALLLPGSAANACTCASPSAPAQDRADAVFVAEVTAVESPAPRADRAVATFAVEAVYKGEVEQIARVVTPLTEATCGIVFVPGERYTVFADASGGELSTGICHGTAPGEVTVGIPTPVVRYTIPVEPRASVREPPRGRDPAKPIVLLALAAVLVVASGTGVVLAVRDRGRLRVPSAP